MGTLALTDLPNGALLLIDSSPLIYYIENHPKWEPHFRPVFEPARGSFRLAVTTLAIAEVLVGPLKVGDEALARRYRSVFDSWHRIDLDLDIAESAARLRAAYGLKLPDAVQAASALTINADALVTHDRDFSRVPSLRVIS